jgi:hypothetical protein
MCGKDRISHDQHGNININIPCFHDYDSSSNSDSESCLKLSRFFHIVEGNSFEKQELKHISKCHRCRGLYKNAIRASMDLSPSESDKESDYNLLKNLIPILQTQIEIHEFPIMKSCLLKYLARIVIDPDGIEIHRKTIMMLIKNEYLNDFQNREESLSIDFQKLLKHGCEHLNNIEIKSLLFSINILEKVRDGLEQLALENPFDFLHNWWLIKSSLSDDQNDGYEYEVESSLNMINRLLEDHQQLNCSSSQLPKQIDKSERSLKMINRLLEDHQQLNCSSSQLPKQIEDKRFNCSSSQLPKQIEDKRFRNSISDLSSNNSDYVLIVIQNFSKYKVVSNNDHKYPISQKSLENTSV